MPVYQYSEIALLVHLTKDFTRKKCQRLSIKNMLMCLCKIIIIVNFLMKMVYAILSWIWPLNNINAVIRLRTKSVASTWERRVVAKVFAINVVIANVVPTLADSTVEGVSDVANVGDLTAILFTIKEPHPPFPHRPAVSWC